MTHLLWQSDLGDGNYKNPILFADYSDPDVICVGDTYYMTASSFNYTPGLPILISKDMVNWELKNYAIKNIEYAAFEEPAHAKGIWAPAIRYHNNKFWISYGMPDEGIFIISTEDPLGTWSKPVLLLEGKGYIDPCPFWDDDGKAYIVHGYARSRIGFKSILGIFEIDEKATKAISDDTFIFDGTKTQPTIEGPKVHKLNGYYYIFAPAGGVKTGWQTVLRSKYIEGPYEEKIVMHQGNSPTNGPHQGAWVETPEGSHWFIHFQDRGVYGRITHLQPMSWVDGWPMIGINVNAEYCGEPCLVL
jgi:beta-xylosidase